MKCPIDRKKDGMDGVLEAESIALNIKENGRKRPKEKDAITLYVNVEDAVNLAAVQLI
jgi:hypothetical protein